MTNIRNKKLLSLTLAGAAAFAMAVTANAATEDSLGGVVATESGRLNVRAKASAESAVVASAKRNSYLTLEGKTGEWWYVEYENGKFGYCHEDYIDVASNIVAVVNTKDSSLNVRSGAGSKYPIVDSLAKGEKAVILSSNGYWARVLYDGNKIGCVSADYLAIPESGYPTISLSVPELKQTDPRWANVKVGSSSKTIAQIGCVTAGIAMMRTYQTGETVYPDEMMRKLTYDGRGNVYWPTDFEVNYWSENYLETVYQKLKEGKPVLVGAKTKGGSQHWVLVTGFTGGDELTPSKFTINDPGFDNENLGEFFAKYSTLYKFFTYA